MQKQSLFLAANIALVFAMSSVGQAQSYYIVNEYFTGNETYGNDVGVDQGMVQSSSVMPVGVRVSSSQVRAAAPAPSIPVGEVVVTTPYVSPPVPVPIAAVQQHVLSPLQRAVPQFQQAVNPDQYLLPTATIQQPVCTSGG